MILTFPDLTAREKNLFFIGAEIIVGICKNTDMSEKVGEENLEPPLFSWIQIFLVTCCHVL